MRKFFIDNLRWICVLLVVPYHVFLCFNDYHYVYYVYSTPVKFFSTCNLLCDLWFMPLLFFVSGISTTYGLQKRTTRQYLLERTTKLLIPFVSGVLLLVPILAYYARKYYDGYSGDLLDQYIHFFANWGVGSKGVSPYEVGQMWFLLYLLVISVAGLPFITLCQGPCRRLHMASWPLWVVVLLWVPLWGVRGLVPSHPQSLTGSFALFLLGGLFFANDQLQEKLARHVWVLFTLFATCSFIRVGMAPDLPPPWWSNPLEALIMWTGVLSLMGLGRRFLNFSNPVTAYFSASSFSVYIFHQSWLVAIAYFVIRTIAHPWLQALAIVATCLALSFATYELCRRMALTRFIFGIRR
ncbi:MAG: acyltransferase family protein [Thermodesulfobacteriota bacterium]